MDTQRMIIIALVILLGVALFFFFSPSLAKKTTATAVGPFDLSKTQTGVVDSTGTATFVKAEGAGAAISAFLYVNPILRTGEHVACGTQDTMPSCETGEYTPCDCGTGGDCARTCRHVGYTTIFDVANGVMHLEMMRAPDASRPNAAAVQLVFKTQGPPNKIYRETFVLPPIPFQKWLMITVSREGRQYNVYYNDELVLSKSTMYTLNQSSGVGISVGATGIAGQAALVNVYPTALQGSKVAKIYRESSDTRGFPDAAGTGREPGSPDVLGLYPRYNPSLKLSLGDLADRLNLCGEGGCLSAPAIRPASPLYEWTSPYA
jgi:hypothetical protein